MKKFKKSIIALAICAVATTGYHAYERATMTEQEHLMQANLEALTGDESSTTKCDASNTNICKIYSGGLLVAESTGAAIHIN